MIFTQIKFPCMNDLFTSQAHINEQFENTHFLMVMAEH